LTEDREIAEFLENAYNSDILIMISITNGQFYSVSYGKNQLLLQKSYHLTEVAKHYIAQEILGGAKT
jgi:hypothetical protein